MIRVILGTRGTSGVPEFAGSTWVRLQYLLGFQRLGVEAYWVDRLGPWNPYKQRRSLDYVLGQFKATAETFGFGDRYCVVQSGRGAIAGLSDKRLRDVVASADLLLNISGHLPDGDPLEKAALKAYVDVDPGYTQAWAKDMDLGLDRHDLFFTVGQNINGSDFRVPLSRPWVPIRPPVVLSEWPVISEEGATAFKTIMDWRTSQKVVFEGELWEGKREELLRFLTLPKKTGREFELATWIAGGDYGDMRDLHEYGWKVVDPYWFAGNPATYREFIQLSMAEFSTAKHGYVASRSGWVSDRTACYLASGRPALVQSTGQESGVPVGRGLLTFSDMDEAVEGVEAICSDYSTHARAARALAEEYFDSDRILSQILKSAGF